MINVGRHLCRQIDGLKPNLQYAASGPVQIKKRMNINPLFFFYRFQLSFYFQIAHK